MPRGQYGTVVGAADDAGTAIKHILVPRTMMTDAVAPLLDDPKDNELREKVIVGFAVGAAGILLVASVAAKYLAKAKGN